MVTDSRLGAGDGNEAPVDRLRLYERVGPFGWLGLLADVPPLNGVVLLRPNLRNSACQQSRRVDQLAGAPGVRSQKKGLRQTMQSGVMFGGPKAQAGWPATRNRSRRYHSENLKSPTVGAAHGNRGRQTGRRWRCTSSENTTIHPSIKPVICCLSRALTAAFLISLGLLPSSGLSQLPSESHSSESGFVTRLKAALLLETLNAELLSHVSATSTLEGWCATYGLAAPPKIVAERVRNVEKKPTDEQRRELHVTQAETVRYRRVRLLCGTLMLSEADNWYVPERLTREMNKLLDTTNAPFGRVVQSLEFRRYTISVKVQSPLMPPGWETMPPSRIEDMGKPCLPDWLLEHRALLTLPDGTPFSEVVETYTGNVLSMPTLGLHSCSSRKQSGEG
jgi:hypothetical protein